MRSYLKYLTLLFLLLGTEDFEAKAERNYGYNIKITSSDIKREKVYLIDKTASSTDTVIDSATFNSRGRAQFKSSKRNLSGEYAVVIENDSLILSLMFSRQEKIKEDISIRDHHIIHKGSEENDIYIEYQNLIRNEWTKLSSEQDFLLQLEQIVKKAEDYDKQSLLFYYFAIRFPHFIDDLNSATESILSDPRILNTSFLQTLTNDFIKEQNNADISGTIRNIEIFLSLCANNEIKSIIAKTLFDHYHESKFMGSENICVHIAENHFLTGDDHIIDETSLALLKIYVEYNKHSLIGMQAPDIVLYDTLLNPVSFTEISSEYKILYFYDDQCSTCRRETPKLIDLISLYQNSDVNLYMIFTEDDPERMKSYIRSVKTEFSDIPDNKIYYLWDPFSQSDWSKLYSVLIRPQIFLIDRDNTILGRNLSTSSLATLLQQYSEKSSGLHSLFDDYFKEYLTDPYSIELQDLFGSIDILYDEASGDTALFKEIFRELYLYLKRSDIYELQLGAVYLAEKYILTGNVWDINSEFYRDVDYAIELFYRNPLGTRAKELELFDDDGNMVKIHDTLSDYTVLYFYDTDCPICEALSDSMNSILKEFGDKLNVSFISIYVKDDYLKWSSYVSKKSEEWINLYDPYHESGMFSQYDLSTVPSIYLLDRDKIVVAKDITPSTLKAIFVYLCEEK